MEPAKLLAIANRVKTPLALAGGVVAVLYLIYRQVLLLGVFENIGAQPTFLLLQNVLNKVFWLALIAIILAVGSHVAGIALSRRMSHRKSDVALVDASFDQTDSPYIEIQKGAGKVIRARRRKAQAQGPQ